MSDASARERRAAERKRRRDRPEPTDEGSTHLQDALRSAASAAAVGAAVGAAKAMSTRRREDHDAPDTADEAREAPGREEPPKAAEPAEPQQREPQEQEPDPEPVDSGALREIVAQARGVLRELHGSDAESVSSVSRSTAGWNVALEVVELRRIPDSTDVLASYQVELDEDGRLIRYERVRRYNRSQANAGGRDA